MGAIAYLDSLAIGTSIELTTQRGERVFATGVAGASSLPFALVTTAAFTMPAVNGTVVAAVNTTAPLAVGTWVFVLGAGWLAVTAIGGPTSATLRNIAGVAGNAAPTTVIAPALAIPGGPALEPTMFDVRRFGATPLDLGPGLRDAIAAAAANFGGTVYVPPLFGGGLWNWVTPFTSDLAGFEPGSIEILGAATNVQLLSSDTTATMMVVKNAAAAAIRVAGFNFVGNPAIGQDCDNLLEIGFVGACLVERLGFFGCAGATSLLNLNAQVLKVDALNINACSQSGALGGLLYCSGFTIDIGNVRKFDIGIFDASAASKVGGQSDVFVLSADTVSIHDCLFDEDTQRNIYITQGFAGFFTSAVKIARCRFNVPNPANGLECSLKTDGPGRIRMLEIEDCAYEGARQGFIANLANVDNVRITGCFTAAGSTGNGTPNPLDGPHLIETRANVGNLTIIDSDGAFALAPTGGAPASFTLTQNGKTVSELYGVPGLLALYDPGQLMNINPAFNLGVAGTFAAVTAGHHLNFTFNGSYHFAIPFLGTENSAASFAATMQTFLNANIQGATATVVGGQVKLSLPPAGGGNFYFVTESQGTIDASSADVLASLGMTVGAFTNPSTVANATGWGDSVGTDATHNLTVITGSPVYKFQSSSFANRPTVTTALNDILQSSVWTAPVAQPATVAIIGRVTSGSTGTFFASLIAGTPFNLEGSVPNQFFYRCGATVAFAATAVATPSVFLCRFDGAGSDDFAQNTTTPTAAQNAGANGFTGVTLGNTPTGGDGGVEIALVAVFNHALTLSERRLVVELAANRYGIVEV